MASRAQAATVRTLEDLVAQGVLPAVTPDLQSVASTFGIAITPAMIKIIDSAQSSDPIAAQFVPSSAELNILPNERIDPIGDAAYSPVEGIVHRYPDRVLLKLLYVCAVYCRFCFRREQVGQTENALATEAVNAALDYIRTHAEIWEVILTGGDPFVLSERRLSEVIEQLNSINHVKVIRIHTRIPVVSPERITPDLVKVLRGRVPVYVLLHCNHARELSSDARSACARLVDAGIPMLSQTVLLRGVNDNVEALTELMRTFVECRIKPHYLHQGDLARGTSHFRVPLAKGQELMRKLRGHVSGLCQPTYMLDIPGGYGKVPVGPHYDEINEKGWVIEDFRGQRHFYND
jgi:lysine 2,3-aminomutase